MSIDIDNTGEMGTPLGFVRGLAFSLTSLRLRRSVARSSSPVGPGVTASSLSRFLARLGMSLTCEAPVRANSSGNAGRGSLSALRHNATM